MPPRVVVVTVGFEELADPKVGEWCGACFLPSAVGIKGCVTLDGRPWQIRTFLVCTECHVVTDG